MPRKSRERQYRFGIGEWYGKAFVLLAPKQRKELAQLQSVPKKERPFQRCPFQSRPESEVACNKEGGVCSLRLYMKDPTTNEVRTAEPPMLPQKVPKRFKEDNEIYRWVAVTILEHDTPIILKEIPFLESTIPREGDDQDQEAGGDAVGKIDNILVVPASDPLRWCALEIQTVYFSGARMSKDFEQIRSHSSSGIPFPAGNRHPDYRSSAPKRLMPQLQIKVPSLRRWGKKIAVVVDQDFYKNMGPMQEVRDVSNCDVAWFIVRFDESQGNARIVRDKVHLTTLEQSVEGLTAGIPVSLATFEERIRTKIGS